MVDMSKLPYIIAVDFDGTLCEDAYPEIGKPKQDIIQVIKQCKEEGCKIILWTCRNREQLIHAVDWCMEQGLEFDAVNRNIPEVQELFEGDTRKVYANLYLDDKNVLLKEVIQIGVRNHNTR